jgi:hypothetical protein
MNEAAPHCSLVGTRWRDSLLTAQFGYHPPCFRLLQNPNDLSLSKQTFPHVVLLAPFEFGRTLFLTGVDLGGTSRLQRNYVVERFASRLSATQALASTSLATN